MNASGEIEIADGTVPCIDEHVRWGELRLWRGRLKVNVCDETRLKDATRSLCTRGSAVGGLQRVLGHRKNRRRQLREPVEEDQGSIKTT
jgi:hypothetical protein